MLRANDIHKRYEAITTNHLVLKQVPALVDLYEELGKVQIDAAKAHFDITGKVYAKRANDPDPLDYPHYPKLDDFIPLEDLIALRVEQQAFLGRLKPILDTLTAADTIRNTIRLDLFTLIPEKIWVKVGGRWVGYRDDSIGRQTTITLYIEPGDTEPDELPDLQGTERWEVEYKQSIISQDVVLRSSMEARHFANRHAQGKHLPMEQYWKRVEHGDANGDYLVFKTSG